MQNRFIEYPRNLTLDWGCSCVQATVELRKDENVEAPAQMMGRAHPGALLSLQAVKEQCQQSAKFMQLFFLDLFS